MIKILSMCIALLLATTGAAECGGWRDLNTRVEKSGLDTPIHIGVGAAVAAVTYHYLPDDMNIWWRRGIAFAVPVALGTIKETTDVNFDAGDIVGYAVGGGISLTLFSLTF